MFRNLMHVFMMISLFLGGCAVPVPTPEPPVYPVGYLNKDHVDVAHCVRVGSRVVAPLHLFSGPQAAFFSDQPIDFIGFAPNRAVEVAHGKPSPFNPLDPVQSVNGDWAAIQLAGTFGLPDDPDPPFWEIAEEMPKAGSEVWVWRHDITPDGETWKWRVVTFVDAETRDDGSIGTMRFKLGSPGQHWRGWSGSMAILPPSSPRQPWRWLGLVTGSTRGPESDFMYACRPPRAVMEWLRTGNRDGVPFRPVQSNFNRLPKSGE